MLLVVGIVAAIFLFGGSDEDSGDGQNAQSGSGSDSQSEGSPGEGGDSEGSGSEGGGGSEGGASADSPEGAATAFANALSEEDYITANNMTCEAERVPDEEASQIDIMAGAPPELANAVPQFTVEQVNEPDSSGAVAVDLSMELTGLSPEEKTQLEEQGMRLAADASITVVEEDGWKICDLSVG